jgi:hypothetical protein
MSNRLANVFVAAMFGALVVLMAPWFGDQAGRRPPPASSTIPAPVQNNAGRNTLAPCGHTRALEWTASEGHFGRCEGGHVFEVRDGVWFVSSAKPNDRDIPPGAAFAAFDAAPGLACPECGATLQVKSRYAEGRRYNRCFFGHVVVRENGAWKQVTENTPGLPWRVVNRDWFTDQPSRRKIPSRKPDLVAIYSRNGVRWIRRNALPGHQRVAPKPSGSTPDPSGDIPPPTFDMVNPR